MNVVLWTGVGYLLGALPFSVWLGQVLSGRDIRQVGDGNPGAANAWKAGGWVVGFPALLLDYLKGVAPVGLAHFGYGLAGWALVPVALAPVLGHGFSPFLRFRGGKALAVSFGVWTGVTLGEVPIVLGAFMGSFLLLLAGSAWAVLLGMLGLLAHLLLRRADATTLAMWAGNTVLLAWKHRHELRHPLQPRPWLSNSVRRNP
jgi:glycerol-3-phosphate acyltransferase PlsY